jgi:hypothetical protein
VLPAGGGSAAPSFCSSGRRLVQSNLRKISNYKSAPHQNLAGSIREARRVYRSRSSSLVAFNPESAMFAGWRKSLIACRQIARRLRSRHIHDIARFNR